MAYWDGREQKGRQVVAGIYIYRLETNASSIVCSMVLVK